MLELYTVLQMLTLLVKYLSPATSTFILRVARAHYRIIWAALSLMNSVPIQDGKKCVFRVVRVSGTIRKAEEEAIRRARELILKAQREAEDKGETALQGILGGPVEEDSSKDLTAKVTMIRMKDEQGYHWFLRTTFTPLPPGGNDMPSISSSTSS